MLFSSCGSRRWVLEMMRSTPYGSLTDLLKKADQVWNRLSMDDWHEAFGHHPRIGNLESIRTKFSQTAEFASREQAGVENASEKVLRALAERNHEYESRFGHIFLVCATGKTASEMLVMLEKRINNNPQQERRIAGTEQLKITKIRLQKLISNQENP